MLSATNGVNESLQSPNLYLLRALQEIDALKHELRRLREDKVWEAGVQTAKSLEEKLGFDDKLPATRQRKVPRRIDDHAFTQVVLTPLQVMKAAFYVALTDRLITELDARFPSEMIDFAFLDPLHFVAIDGERRVHQLASRYEQLDPDQVITEWRLSHHIVSANATVTEAYSQLQTTMHQLRFLYQVLLTLPVTTASVERGFSKLSLVKSKLRSTMNQDRLESLLLASIEKYLLLAIKDKDLVARFASTADQRMLLA